MTQRTPQEKVMLTLSGLASLSIGSFAIMRFISGDFDIALLDSLISAAMFAFFLFIFITRKINIANILMVLFILMAVLMSIIVKGDTQSHWIHPAVIATYYLLPQKKAVIFSSIALIIISIVLYPKIDIVAFSVVVTTALLTLIFSYVIFGNYAKKQKELTRLTSIDALTLAKNRRALDKKLAKVILRQSRKEYNMCLILLDVDHFKKVNDQYGHAVGDKILVNTCELISKNIRVLDTLYRYGGEEFVIMPLDMELSKAQVIAEKLRQIIENHSFTQGVEVTISLGVAQYKKNETSENWISRADSALYKAKNSGRNKVCLGS